VSLFLKRVVQSFNPENNLNAAQLKPKAHGTFKKSNTKSVEYQLTSSLHKGKNSATSENEVYPKPNKDGGRGDFN
jgi:hypothetical protein